MSEWKSIDTAPKSGCAILIGRGGKNKIKYVMQAYWDERYDRWDSYCGLPAKQPTHWMHMPDLPETE